MLPLMFSQSYGTYQPTTSWSAAKKGAGAKGILRVKEIFLGNQKMPPAYEVCILGEELKAPPVTSSDSTNTLNHQTVIWAPTHAGMC